MKANDAKRLVSEAEATKKREMKKAGAKSALRKKEMIALGKKRATAELKKLMLEIEKAAGTGLGKLNTWITYEDAEHGWDYLDAMGASIKRRLEKQGYVVEIEVRNSYGAVYEGTMDPCLVETPYCRTILDVSIIWEK